MSVKINVWSPPGSLYIGYRVELLCAESVLKNMQSKNVNTVKRNGKTTTGARDPTSLPSAGQRKTVPFIGSPPRPRCPGPSLVSALKVPRPGQIRTVGHRIVTYPRRPLGTLWCAGAAGKRCGIGAPPLLPPSRPAPRGACALGDLPEAAVRVRVV